MITGAARGIGRASAVALARAGAAVGVGIDTDGPVSAILDFEPGTLVEQAGARWLAISLDQRNIGLLRQAAQTVEGSFGGIDVLFANAGIQAFKLRRLEMGLIGLIKSVALGVHRITVNALNPKLVDTKLTRHEDRYAAALAAGGQIEGRGGGTDDQRLGVRGHWG